MLFWEKSFEDQIEPFQTEMLSSFLSAINHNIKEMIANSSKGIKNIEMGNLIVIVTDIKSLGVEMVTISDSDNEKNIRKIIPEFIKILNENASLFKDFDGNMSVFEILDFKILQIIEKNKKILKKGKVLKEKLEIKEKRLTGQEGNKFVHEVRHPHYDKYTKFDEERKFLEDRLKETAALPKKIEILNSIDQIDHKLKEKPNIEKNKQRRKKFQVELQSTKERMKYFLEQTKQAINRSIQHSKGKLIYETDFKDAYLNLYSFSSKLKFIGRDDLCTEYREFAKILIEKPEDQEHNFSNVIKKILDLSEDMESYFK
ncbi:hypothetical protein DSAG12_03657 [Promethearchaeum syntrophicum]|uniref:Uncharacterized protein n=1 Tax=Promethearchaeum syntrophicum TaxID=2594042 RepID=A0A5B9DER6_9ARCH